MTNKAAIPWELVNAFTACPNVKAWRITTPFDNLALIVPEKQVTPDGVEYFWAYFK